MTSQKPKRRFKDSRDHIVTPLGISGGCVVFMREDYQRKSPRIEGRQINVFVLSFMPEESDQPE